MHHRNTSARYRRLIVADLGVTSIKDIIVSKKDISSRFVMPPFACCATSGYVTAMFTPAQLRAARALIDWSRDDLARASGVSAITIKIFESGGSDPRLSTLTAIRIALQEAGVVFLQADETNGPGVALRRLDVGG